MAWVAWPGAVGAAQACQASLSPAVQQVGPCKTWLSVQLSVGWGGRGQTSRGPAPSLVILPSSAGEKGPGLGP